jgi:lipopolysaccharide export system protein LptC
MSTTPLHLAKAHAFERSNRKNVRPVGGMYDRIVFLLKRILPAAALLLFAMLVLLPFLNKREVSFLLSRDSIEKTPEVLRMEKPSYRGLDSKGRPFVLTAERAIQNSSEEALVELQKLTANIATAAGAATLTSELGAFDLKREQLRISGGISVSRADGYRFQAQSAVLDLTSRMAWGVEGVSGDAPLGLFRARKFQVNVETGTVTFSGGTKLRIVPKR